MLRDTQEPLNIVHTCRHLIFLTPLPVDTDTQGPPEIPTHPVVNMYVSINLK